MFDFQSPSHMWAMLFEAAVQCDGRRPWWSGGGGLFTVIPFSLSRANHIVMKNQTVSADRGASFASVPGGRRKLTTMPNLQRCQDVCLHGKACAETMETMKRSVGARGGLGK